LRPFLLDLRREGKTLGDDFVDGGVEGEADVGSGDAKIFLAVSGPAIAGIDYAVVEGIDGGLKDGCGHPMAQRFKEVAGAARGIAVGKHIGAVVLEDSPAHGFGGAQNTAVGDGSAEGRGHGDNRGNVIGPLRGYRAGHDSAQAVTDEMDLASGFMQGPVDAVIETVPDEDVGTLRVQRDAGKVRGVSNASDPEAELREVMITAEKAGNNDDSRSVSVGNAEAIVNGGGVEQQELNCKQRFLPDCNVSFCFVFSKIDQVAYHCDSRAVRCRFLQAVCMSDVFVRCWNLGGGEGKNSR